MKKLNYLIVLGVFGLINTTMYAQEFIQKVKTEVKEILQEEKVEVKLSEL